jgi:hypothetical protein
MRDYNRLVKHHLSLKMKQLAHHYALGHGIPSVAA